MTTFRDVLNGHNTGDNEIDFRPWWRWSLPAASTLTLASALLVVFVGFNLSIDFEGGGIYEVEVPAGTTVADVREAISQTDVRIQLVESADGVATARVQTAGDQIGASATIVGELAEFSEVSIDEVAINEVGPTWGKQITNKALRALVFFFIAVGIYLSFSLEWQMALGALASVVHDLLVTAGVYIVLGLEVSPATVVALLTIMGYSIYDTVVVFDKVKENEAELYPGLKKESYGAEGPPRRARPRPVIDFAALANTATNQVMMRSINAAVTSVLPTVSMLVIGGMLLGGETLYDFGLALFVGLIAGTYSSVFFSMPLQVWIKTKTDPSAKNAERPKVPTKSLL